MKNKIPHRYECLPQRAHKKLRTPSVKYLTIGENLNHYQLSIDQRITVVKGFAHSHRTGDDAQITHGVSVLLANLSAGARVSDALINAEAAYNNAKRMPRRRITINRRLASASSKAQPSALQC